MHDWKLGWKEHKKYFVDICQICGMGRLLGIDTLYLTKEDTIKFLTTNKTVDPIPYRDCRIKK